MPDKQRTIKKATTVSGTGLHTGLNATLTFKPAPANFGFKFQRIDLPGSPIIDADIDLVVDTARGTTLEYNNARIYTVEHFLAALTGLSIDNVLIELDKDEIPIMDGSSRYFVDALLEAGIVELDAQREYIVIEEEIIYKNELNRIEMIALPDDHYNLEVEIDYETKVLGKQFAQLNNISEFQTEFSPCRTFVFLHELEFLLNNNLIKGGDLSNAIVYVNRQVTQEELDRLAELFNKPKVKVKEEGILNNLDLHFKNESARHKLLDVIGDLSLLGKPIKGKILAKRPGHYSNVQFARLIKEQINNQKKMNTKPPFDLTKKPVYDVVQIQQILPHRPPFLFVDKVLDMNESQVVGVKNITMNESFFVGHFPGEPVLPGVIQVEAMAQTGGILALSQVKDPENYKTYFLKIDNVKYRHKVIPGDTMVFSLELISPIRRGICHMRGIAYVGETIVMEAEMMALLSKNEDQTKS
ncbi:MAG: UDP-3-O-[3-hydroxymyristoyl] N-acetylglucosamine deacetylase [Bacteroidetes bacterium HGW-Bacteroidetes-17]|nr:MAG: UDP-3-O-[3-hydroxymyristoyl] N-acetylglucosamine deacetylase [Bacteroidetes bacterium HGW-Bacteroidetes-17]